MMRKELTTMLLMLIALGVVLAVVGMIAPPLDGVKADTDHNAIQTPNPAIYMTPAGRFAPNPQDQMMYHVMNRR